MSNEHAPLTDLRVLLFRKAEAGVIGSVLAGRYRGMQKEVYRHAAQTLTVDDFERKDSQVMWRIMGECVEAGEPWCELSLTMRMAEDGFQDVGGTGVALAYYLECMPTPDCLDYYVGLVKEWSRRRRVQSLGRVAQAQAAETAMPVPEILTDIRQRVDKLSAEHVEDRFQIGMHLDEALDGEAEILRFPISGLEDMVSPLEVGSQVIIGGQPGSGKTALILQALIGFARAGIQCSLFSYEMRYAQVSRRLLSSMSGVPFAQTTKGRVHKESFPLLSKAALELKRLPLRWVHCASAPPDMLMSLIEAEAPDSKVIALDYIQMAAMYGKGKDRRDDVDRLSSGLKGLAQEYGLVTLVASQIRRPAADARRHEPALTDLKESSGLEQDADIVLLTQGLVRAEIDNRRRVAVRVAKNRNGPADCTRVLVLDGPTMTFKGRSENQEVK